MVKRMPKVLDAENASCAFAPVLSRKKGRPSNAMAGDIDARILDAATAIFVKHGFGGASLERIAKAANAGKSTLYSRYKSKNILFAEVVNRNCERSMRLVFEAPQLAALPQRLAVVAQTLVQRLLSDEVIGLIRIAVAGPLQFPSLVKLLIDAGKVCAIDAAATMLAEQRERDHGARACNAKNRFCPRTEATHLLNAIISPMLMRALLGENLVNLRRDLRSHVNQTIAFSLAAKRLDTILQCT